ncbi:MAG: recombination protein RecO [Sulfurovum sp.]|nr:recombination protein RecO [Sulfurovum sp.]
MKGFVVALRRAKNEDSIAIVLTDKSARSYYRFFGARHSILQLGHLIDFEVEGEDGRFLPRLRSLSQMGFKWLRDRNRLMLWHNFIKLFEPHLRDTEELDRFYFDLLLKAARKWDKQNPKRIVCESYVELLKFEGRIYPIGKCYICEQDLGESVSLMTSFKPAHPECIYASAINKSKIDEFFREGKTIYLNDSEIDILYSVVIKGL